MLWLGRLVYVVERRRLAMRGPPTGRGNPFSSQRTPKPTPQRLDDVDSRGDVPGTGSVPGGVVDSRASVARKQVVNMVSSRREAAAGSPFSEDPGLRYWISRQRWMWRKSKLDPERVKMLQLAGIDMDIYPADDWRRAAHLAAERLQGASLELPFSWVGSGEIQNNTEEGNAGSVRLQVLRWVETQRALFVDGRLSPGQLRYMTFLGLTWVLSDKVVDANDSIWLAYWKSLKAHMHSEENNGPLPFDLQDWIGQQRALCYLSLLDESRRAKLSSLGISLDVEEPSTHEHEWNTRLSQLFIHTQEVGHVDVSEATHPELSGWLEECKALHQNGCLAPSKVSQLKSLGVRF